MAPLHLVGGTRSLFFPTRVFRGLRVRLWRMQDVIWCFSYQLCCKLIVTIKRILGLADQRPHASTFECVRLCSEGKIRIGPFKDGPYELYKKRPLILHNPYFQWRACLLEQRNTLKCTRLLSNKNLKFPPLCWYACAINTVQWSGAHSSSKSWRKSISYY